MAKLSIGLGRWISWLTLYDQAKPIALKNPNTLMQLKYTPMNSGHTNCLRQQAKALLTLPMKKKG
jgi:hypothetical protein